MVVAAAAAWYLMGDSDDGVDRTPLRLAVAALCESIAAEGNQCSDDGDEEEEDGDEYTAGDYDREEEQETSTPAKLEGSSTATADTKHASDESSDLRDASGNTTSQA